VRADLKELADLAEAQGWRTRVLQGNGYMLYPKDPAKRPISLRPSGDFRVQQNWRAELRRAGLVLPEDQRRKPKTREIDTLKPTTTGQANTPPAPHPAQLGPEPTLADLIARARRYVNDMVDRAADFSEVLGEIEEVAQRGDADRKAKVRELMKELLA
jgi:hypothetical protein